MVLRRVKIEVNKHFRIKINISIWWIGVESDKEEDA